MSNSTNDPEFADQLRDAVRKSGLTQVELARRLGVTQSAISQFLSGSKWAAEPTVNALAREVGLKVTRTRKARR